jgi:hypothetical protein
MEDGYENTVLGLLRKRAALIAELEFHRDKAGVASNDISAVDRVLQTLGYDGTLDNAQPRKKALNFIKHEVRRSILEEMRKSDRPLSSRELAVKLAAIEGVDAADRRVMRDLTSRVSRSICILLDRQVVSRGRSGTQYVYKLA